jgi:hypothetical protein
MTPEQRAQLRDAGRQAAAKLPDLSPDQCRRVAALLAEAVNEYVKTERHKQIGGAA